MNKQEFLEALRKGLSGLAQEDIERSTDFYGEMIDDRIEEGLTEEDAVAEIGTVENAVSQILSEISLSKIVKEKVKLKRALRVWEIVFLVLGSPIWLSLLIFAFAIALFIYILIWLVIISLWAAEFGIFGCSLGGILSSVIFIFQGSALAGVAVFGVGLVAGGLSILLFIGCTQATKVILLLTKKTLLSIKFSFIGRVDVK